MNWKMHIVLVLVSLAGSVLASPDNHSETTIITDEQKAILRKQSLTSVYWKEEDPK